MSTAAVSRPSIPGPLPAALQGLEPEGLWRVFGKLASLPRPSKHEDKVLSWLEEFAAAHGLTWKRDSSGNTVLYRPGSGGGEAAPTVIIQGHVDIVTEKNADKVFDFFTQGVDLVREDDWITADGTTLGADNGIGVAAALAILASPPDAKLPPLEVLLTTDEEAGMGGAFGLDGTLLEGRTLINLDTEEWGEVYVGCAGGGDSRLLVPVETAPAPAGSVALSVTVKGLLGGHSGVNIHEDRANAVRLLARAVAGALEAAGEGSALAGVAGGDKRNAIPREASATLLVPTAGVPAARAALARLAEAFSAEYGTLETKLVVQATEPAGAPPASAFAAASTGRLLTLLQALPHGPLKYSHAVEGLVETSNNLASVNLLTGPEAAEAGATADGSTVVIEVVNSSRSSIASALQAVRASIKALGTLAGAKVLQESSYPGWAPEPEAHVVREAIKAIGSVTGAEVGIKAIHAGLECGLLSDKLPGVKCVSFGPTITGAHSPDERVQISTVAPFFEATRRLVEALADARA